MAASTHSDPDDKTGVQHAGTRQLPPDIDEVGPSNKAHQRQIASLH